MDRRGDLRSTFFLAAAVAALLACAPAAGAAEPATLEYNLDLPSARDVPLGADGIRGPEPLELDQSGVSGEAPPSVESPLSSLADLLLSIPVALALVAVVAGAAFVARGAAPRPGTG